MSRTIQHENGFSATLLGSLGRIALGVVLSMAVCLVISIALGAGCGGQKEDASQSANQASTEQPSATQTPAPEVGAASGSEQAPAEEQTVTEKPAPKRVANKQAATRKPVETSSVALPAPPVSIVLPVGTVVPTTLETTLETDKNSVGDAVTARTSEPVVAEGATVIPANSIVYGRVTHVRSAGRMKGAAELTVRFTELQLPNGERVAITCDPLRRFQKGSGRETATEIGAGAVVGGALGGLLGGKDDVLAGAAAGAAAGTGIAAATKGHQIVLPAGESVKITLAAPLTLAPVS